MNVSQVNKKHGKPGNSVSSRKKEKVRNARLGIDKPSAFNIKANTQSNYMSKWKYIKKLMDREHKKHHPLISKPLTVNNEEPPILVAIVGPPGVGKSLLVRSLIKHYTTTKISDCRGPMTILANKHRRITFFECPNELNSMIDVAKVCDLALLMVDSTYGFEMETFEFLNAAQLHGFPRVMGVLTKLDKYVKLKKKQSIVYHVKHRFWKEIYSGAKLFVLKGIDGKTGYYFKSDVVNLVRFISVLKFRPLRFRTTHPYIFVDRYSDLTEPTLLQKNKKINRRIAFYGYVRGCNLRKNINVHIPGIGDFNNIINIKEMEDPVPLPNSVNKAKRLLIKNGNVYAPMAHLGPIVFDKNTTYIQVRNNDNDIKKDDKRKKGYETDELYLKRLKKETDNTLIDIRNDERGKKLLDKLNKVNATVDENMKYSQLKIFNNSKPLTQNDINTNKNVIRRKMVFDDENNNNNDSNNNVDTNVEDNEDNYWNMDLLDTTEYKEQEYKQNLKDKRKQELEIKKNRGQSSNILESNARWKQNLLSSLLVSMSVLLNIPSDIKFILSFIVILLSLLSLLPFLFFIICSI